MLSSPLHNLKFIEQQMVCIYLFRWKGWSLIIPFWSTLPFQRVPICEKNRHWISYHSSTSHWLHLFFEKPKMADILRPVVCGLVYLARSCHKSYQSVWRKRCSSCGILSADWGSVAACSNRTATEDSTRIDRARSEVITAVRPDDS